MDFDNNVFVTASGGQLILQFGTPSLPVPGTLTTSGFNTDRFSGPGAGSYVIDDNYTFSFPYTLDATNTFNSASLLADINGVETQIDTISVDSSPITFDIQDYVSYLHSGSHTFKAGLNVQLEDGSDISIDSGDASGTTLSKANPNQPNYTFTWTGLSNDNYITNKTNNSTSAIERGVTGDATYISASSATLRGWAETSVENNKSGNTITFTATGDPSNLTITGNYNSNGLGTPTTTTVNRSKAFNRIISLRYAAFPSGHFTSNLSPTEAELLDVADWTDNGGTLDFNNQNPNGDTFTISWSGDKYIYIVMDDAYTLNAITIDGFGSIGAFTTGTIGGYRFYVTTFIQSGGGGSSADYELST